MREIRRANNFTDECDAQIFAKLKAECGGVEEEAGSGAGAVAIMLAA